ncbi:MAG: SusE domain-containing protein [Bacteroidia bacterium]
MFRKYIITGIMMLSVLAACTPKTEFTPVLKIGNTPAISSPAAGAAIVLEEANMDQIVADFEWAAVDFGFQAAVTYTAQLSLSGDAFANPVTLGIVNTNSIKDLTVGELNAMLIANGFVGNAVNAAEMRVIATVSDDVDPVISDVIMLDITPFAAAVEYGILNVPGAYQGWDPASETTVVYSRQANDSYEGYLYFPDAATAYKYAQGSWDTNWGDTGDDGTLDPGGDDIVAADAGMYLMTVDLAALTHTRTKTDWGLIGSATPGGWDSDQDMTVDPATGVYAITLDLVAGEIKFRANDDWAINYGDTNANDVLDLDGDNIAIETDGNYTIELILNVADYTYTVTKN